MAVRKTPNVASKSTTLVSVKKTVATPVKKNSTASKEAAKAKAAKAKAALAKKNAAAKAKIAKQRATLARSKAIRTAAVSAIRLLSVRHNGASNSRLTELVNDNIGKSVARHGAKHNFNAIHVERAGADIFKAGSNFGKVSSFGSAIRTRLARQAASKNALTWAKNNPVK
jgi:hypothetical protein